MRIDRCSAGCALPVRLLIFGVLAASLSMPAAAQTPQAQPAAPAAAPAELPSARSILDRHVKAVGGRTAIMGHSSMRTVGAVTIPAAGITGTLEVLSAKPNLSWSKQTIAGIGEVMEGFNGTTAWGISPLTGPMVYQGKEFEQKRLDADFYGELAESSRYTSMTTLERTTFNGRPAHKVRLVRKDGTESFEFFDVETGLKAGATTTRETHMGPASIATILTDYKKFGDMLHPTTIRSTTVNVELVITVSSVEYDTVRPSAFELPEQIKALVK